MELTKREKKKKKKCNANDEDVLEGLQPHPDIKSSWIVCCMGKKFPSWLLMPVLNNLVELKLEKCNNCQQLSSLGHLPYLKILEIEEMNGVNHTGSEF